MWTMRIMPSSVGSKKESNILFFYERLLPRGVRARSNRAEGFLTWGNESRR
jgi:hypothetical protein